MMEQSPSLTWRIDIAIMQKSSDAGILKLPCSTIIRHDDG